MNPNPNNFINVWIELPTIWVKSKNENVIGMITGFHKATTKYTKDTIDFSYGSADMEYLFEKYTFLDGSVCGVEV